MSEQDYKISITGSILGTQYPRRPDSRSNGGKNNQANKPRASESFDKEKAIALMKKTFEEVYGTNTT